MKSLSKLLPPDELSLATLRHRAIVISIWYLSIPLVIFLTGWLTLVIAVPVTALLVIGVGLYASNRNRVFERTREQDQETVFIPRNRFLAGLAIVTVPALLCGAGGFGSQAWDWTKHNAILSDLINHPWPVIYQTEKDAVALVYYVAYYLPAAILGKAFGWAAANYIVFITTWIGVALAYLWLTVFARGAALLAALILVFFSGMDILGAMIVNPPAVWPEFVDAFFLDWWGRHWQYSSNLSLLYFVPQQALGAWIATALLIDGITRNQFELPVLLVMSAAALWSPFGVVGMLPVAGYFVYKAYRSTEFVKQDTFANLAGLCVGVLVLLYFLSRYFDFQLPDFYVEPENGRLPGAFEFMLSRLEPGQFFRDYFVFVSIEFLLVAGLLIYLLKQQQQRDMYVVVVIAVVSLLIIPFFYLGIFNDLAMRTSIPGLFILQVAAVMALTGSRKGVPGLLIMAILVIGGFYSTNLVRMYTENAINAKMLVRMPEQQHVPTLLHIPMAPALRLSFHSQYVGAAGSPFFRWFAPDPNPVPVAVPES